jgi:hypothetical protein
VAIDDVGHRTDPIVSCFDKFRYRSIVRPPVLSRSSAKAPKVAVAN